MTEKGDPHLFVFASQLPFSLAPDLVSSRHHGQGQKDGGEEMGATPI